MAIRIILSLAFSGVLLSGCATGVQVSHEPLVATSDEEITFTAKSFSTTPGPDSIRIQILVNAALAKECTYSPCIFTGGPYNPGYLQYAANVSSEADFLGYDIESVETDGYYHTEVTFPGYISSTGGSAYLRGRIVSSTSTTSDNADLVFHMADDYADAGETLADFIGDASNKVQDILGEQEIIEENLNHFNFWVYTKEAQADGCGTVHSDANSDMPWRDIDGVLHTESFQDCTSGNHFSAEGYNTKAFLHEFAHAFIGLGDEYDGDTCYPCVDSPEPNIFPTQTDCQSEQTLKGRDPAQCYEFTLEDGGWWGIHTGTTVMTTGNVGNPWGTEAEERVDWYFDSF